MPFDSTNFQKPPAEVDEVGQIILKARELLSNPNRWCKGDHGFAGEHGQYCILGALNAVGGFGVTAAGVRVTVEIKNSVAPGLSVVRFNDAPETTHSDVLALLDRAAKASP